MLTLAKIFLGLSICILLISFFILIVLKIDNGFILNKINKHKENKIKKKILEEDRNNFLRK